MSESTHTLQDLQQMQALPLKLKVQMTKRRISQWIDEYGTDGVYVAFSGGKDSTVLLHLAREVDPTIRAMFVDTGLEYPEIRDFVKTFDNVDWIKPKMNFRSVIEKYGYPFISKEVSETVYGARRYLTKQIERIESSQTDRQTDRQTDTLYLQVRKLYGGEEFTSRNIKSLQEQDDIGVGSQEDWIVLTKALPNCGNEDLQLLLGIYGRKGKATQMSIPSGNDRSAFSCAKYRFFLDAPFEIGSGCCAVMKKSPSHKYARDTGGKPMTAEMASESRLRTQKWLKSGCNGFHLKKPKSMPMAFWTEQDVLLYIYQNNIPMASVYGDIRKVNEVEGQLDWDDLGLFDIGAPLLETTGVSRTGCMFCGYGCHLEKSPSRFERMKETHPKQYNYIMKPWEEGGLGYKDVIDWINIHGNLNIRY